MRPGRGARPALPEGRSTRVWGLAAVLLVSTVAVIPLLSRGINPYDEGMVVTGADQVLHGRRPAVDFYSPYGPGVFYALAAAFRLFGTRLLVERWFAGFLIILTGALGYLLLSGRHSWAGDQPTALNGTTARRGSWLIPPSRITRDGIAAITGLLIVLMMVSGWWYTPLNSGALVWMLLSGLALQRALASFRNPLAWAALAGALTGVALVWRLTFGGALLLANAITWVFSTGDEPPGDRERVRRSGLLVLIAAAAVVAVPVYGLLIGSGGERALKSLLVWPLTSTGQANLPWPPFTAGLSPSGISLLDQLAGATHGAGFYYGIAALGLLLWRLPLRSFAPADRRLGLWLLLLLPPMFIYANGRTDYLHVTPLLVISLLLAALAVVSGLAVRSQRRTGEVDPESGMLYGEASPNILPPALKVWQALGLLLWTASVLLLVPTILYSWIEIRGSAGRTPLELPGPRGAGVYAPYRFSRNYRALMPLIHHHVAPAHAIYSGTRRHDVYLTNDILLYFLAERNPATYYWCLDAGVTTTGPVQEQMVAELARGAVSAAVIWTAPTAGEQNKGGQSSGVRRVDEWLEREFVPMRLQGLQYEIWARKGLWRGP